jgi:diguanylate cyclase (GGDEF)-like protein/PAS domain S-box-containing protein
MGSRREISGSQHVRTDPTRDASQKGTDANLLADIGTDPLGIASLVLESSADGFVAHDLDGHLIYFNKTAAEQFGYTRDEFAALGPYGWVGDGNIALVPSRLALLRERGSLLFSSRVTLKDGSIMHTEVHARLVDVAGTDIVVALIRDVTERVLAHERIHHLAFHDRLTGLANRMKLEDSLREAMVSADRHGDLVGAIYLDLDDFKPVNDEFGHAVGDFVLREVATRMRSCVRARDTVARLGGDEFLVLVTRAADRKDLATVARKLEQRIEQPIAVEGHPDVRVTASTGLATYEHGESAEDLMNRADHAMYRAKQAGVSGVVAFLSEV